MKWRMCNTSSEHNEKSKELTPQSGTEAVPAWGPPSDMKFLTCFSDREKREI